jgi:hypothetical protein
MLRPICLSFYALAFSYPNKPHSLSPQMQTPWPMERLAPCYIMRGGPPTYAYIFMLDVSVVTVNYMDIGYDQYRKWIPLLIPDFRFPCILSVSAPMLKRGGNGRAVMRVWVSGWPSSKNYTKSFTFCYLSPPFNVDIVHVHTRSRRASAFLTFSLDL